MGQRSSVTAIKVATNASCLKVLEGLNAGLNIGQACHRAKVSKEAFLTAAMKNRAVKKALGSAIITKAYDRLEKRSRPEDANPTVLAAFARLSKEMASSLAPDDWGDKVQVEQTQLVINTNLDFGVVTGFDAAARGVNKVLEGEATEVLEDETAEKGETA